MLPKPNPVAVLKTRLPSLNELAPLQSFKPEIFISQDKSEQMVCNFILSLAIVSNDLKDLQWALHHLGNAKPEKNEKLTRYYGEHSGFSVHINKLLLSALHELIYSIQENKAVLENAIFKKTVKQIPKEFRKSWETVVATAFGEETEIEGVRKTLLMIRNKVTFHYWDLKAINQGFVSRFIDETQSIESRKPFVSLGRNPIETRFYFADALVQNYIEKEIKTSDFWSKGSILMGEINRALRFLVERFIIDRSALYNESERYCD
jgi:hypothetical protein